MKLKEYSSTNVKEIFQCTCLSAKNLFSGLNIDKFCLNHVKADTAIFTIYNKISENGWKGTVVIDAEDTDIYVQVAYVPQKLSGERLIKKKNIYVESRALFTTAMAHVIIQLHVMTVVITTGFYGHGKKSRHKKSYEKLRSMSSVTWMRDVLPIPAHVLNNLKTFVIRYVYGSKVLGCAEAWATQWEKLKKKSMQRLMPDEDIRG